MSGPLQALYARYQRRAKAGALPLPGYAMENVSYCLLLDAQGHVVAIDSLLDTTAKKSRPTPQLVPQGIKRTSGIASNFLWDKTSYVFGVTAKPNKRMIDEHAAFKALHRNLIGDSDDEGLRALLRFLDAWTPERFSASPFKPEMLDANFFFEFELDDDGTRLHEREAARRIWLTHKAAGTADLATCLVTGGEGPITRLHPAIKGVAGAQSSGASIVSFNLDAFTSHGKEQGANAPVSEEAAFGYGTALNALLARDSGNSVRLGDATVAFWAEVPEADGLLNGFFNPPAEPVATEAGETARLRDAMTVLAQGRPVERLGARLDPTTRVYALGLSPNASRLSVRFWHEGSLGELARRATEHWKDLRLEPDPWNGTLPAMWRLLYELAPQRKAENVPAHIAGELARAILTGGRYPLALLGVVVMRMRADRDVNGRRAAIAKAVLARAARWDHSSTGKDDLVSLDKDDPNPGYRLGRLFAVLESVQKGALGRNVNATIRDRYYGAASATPASVFPVLIRNANHHLALLRKTKGGLAYTFEKEMGEILDGIGSTFPKNLRIEDQGRFAIGYYHERFGGRSPLPTEENLPEIPADSDEEP